MTSFAAEDRGALNLALRDQLTALEWVQANIELFGGDKNKVHILFENMRQKLMSYEVTVFGESAGSIMTAVLFLNSPIEKLARAAVGASVRIKVQF